MWVKERARKREIMEGEREEAQRGREGLCQETFALLGGKCRIQNLKKNSCFGNAQLICRQNITLLYMDKEIIYSSVPPLKCWKFSVKVLV